jgi:hypothetical protein
VRIEEAVPKAVKPYLDLEIESYELFQMIARSAIRHLDIARSRDRDAGLPILGTEAARELTPERARAARLARSEARDVDTRRHGRDGADGAGRSKGTDHPRARGGEQPAPPDEARKDTRGAERAEGRAYGRAADRARAGNRARAAGPHAKGGRAQAGATKRDRHLADGHP